ncbi:MAG: SGNH/GDSL hydrolase family protein [Candidatus Methylacidiphilales bacterium]
MKIASLISALTLCVAFLVPQALRAADIAVTDPLIRYVGRFDRQDAEGPRCAWTASSVALTITGGSLNVKLKESGKSFWQVIINGKPGEVLELRPGEQTYSVATNLPAGKHTIELFKRTEAAVGVTQILGFQIEDNQKLLPTPGRKHRIEVIGDSISCGYGNEASKGTEAFTPATQNGWLTYGAIAAREVDADLVCIAWSGKKLHGDNSLPDLYDRVLPNPLEPRWDFTSWTPDVVIINLGTNDFRGGNPDQETWSNAYVEFIRQVRARYPKAPIYVAQGSLMSDWPEDRKPRTTIIGYYPAIIEKANAAAKADGGPPVHFLDFGVQNREDGYGAHMHPNTKTNAHMGDQLAKVLKQDLGW